MIDKKVNLSLVGIDGNAFSIMGAFSQQAKKEGWTKEEIDEVLDEAMSSDYDYLISTIMKHCINYGTGTDDELEFTIYSEDEEDYMPFDEEGSNKYTNSYYT